MESRTKGGEFAQHVVETMRRFGPVEMKRMFGGWGFYHRGVFFALAADDTLYFKSDEENRASFDALRLPPFTFEKQGERIETHYRRAPDETLEDPEEMARWARLAYAAALRARARKAKPTRARPPRAPRKRAAARKG